MSSSRHKRFLKTVAVLDSSESASSSSDDDVIPQTRSSSRITSSQQGVTKMAGSSKRSTVKTSAKLDLTASSSSDIQSSDDNFEPSSDDMDAESTSSSSIDLEPSSSSDESDSPSPKKRKRSSSSDDLDLKSPSSSDNDDDPPSIPATRLRHVASNLGRRSATKSPSSARSKRSRKSSAVLPDVSSSSDDDSKAPGTSPMSSVRQKFLQHKAANALAPPPKPPVPTKTSSHHGRIQTARRTGGPPTKIAKIVSTPMNTGIRFVVKPLPMPVPVPTPVVITSMPPPPPPPPPPPKAVPTITSIVSYKAPSTTTTTAATGTEPSPSTSFMSATRLAPKSQPVCTWSAVVLKHISPASFPDSFLKSGVFQAKLLNSNDPSCKLVLEYLNNSQAHANLRLFLLNVLEIRRPSEDSQCPNAEPPKFTMMLWHGTKQENVAAILGNGFKCPPTGDGKMFGKGVYFADRISKSAQYCKRLPNGNFVRPQRGDVCYLFLCEVVIGKSYNARVSNPSYTTPPSAMRRDGSVMTFDSVMCTGENVPDRRVQREIDGVTWPVGPTVKNGKFQSYTVLYNEYIVYDPEKIKVRYLVKVLFG